MKISHFRQPLTEEDQSQAAKKFKHQCKITSVFYSKPPAIRLFFFLLSFLFLGAAVGKKQPLCPLTFAFTRFDHLIWLIDFPTPTFQSGTPGDTCWYGQHQPVGVSRVRSALQTTVHYKEKCISICHLQSVTAIIEGRIVEVGPAQFSLSAKI